jgi:hypothetical protein
MKRILSRTALTVSLLLPVYFAVAALGVKFGLWDWKLGLGTLIVTWGPRLLIAALILACIALIACLLKRPRVGVGTAGGGAGDPGRWLGVYAICSLADLGHSSDSRRCH